MLKLSGLLRKMIYVGCLSFLISILLFNNGSADAATNQTFIRENIYTFMQSPEKIAALKKGIEVMKSRSDTDPTSWTYQANIHGTQDTRALPAWNTCQHGSFFFPSWHRMYLYYFEKILRKASGDTDLALPYWNYSDSQTQRSLPEPFRSPADDSNSLYVSQRDVGINNGNALPTRDVNYNLAFQSTNFLSLSSSVQSFGGQEVATPVHFSSPHGRLERLPHDQVHVDVGGVDANGRSGWMSSPNTAALDPIFWLHHANIDRLWESWLKLGDGRADPVNDSDWMNTSFTFFDENGQQVQLSGKDIINTVEQLEYRYDDASSSPQASIPTQPTDNTSSPPQPVVKTQLIEPMSVNNQQDSIELSDVPLTVRVPFEKTESSEDTLITEPTTKPLFIKVEGVEYNPNNLVPYEIYINLPQGATPDTESSYYVGKLALFAYPQRSNFNIEITDIVQELQRRQLITDDTISVTFVPPQQIPASRTMEEAIPQLQGKIRFKQVTITGE